MEKEREEFIRRVLAKEKSKAALCREYGISRPTGDKWLERYLSGTSLQDRSSRPFKTPNRIPLEYEERIVAARKQEPAIGAVKIRRMLMDKGWEDPPCVSTFNAVFKRNGLIEKEASLNAMPIQRFEKEAPNIMWQADYKGNYLAQNGEMCYPLSVLDDASRFCLCSDAKRNMQLPGTKESFFQTFLQYGLPDILLCDNGVPWGSSQSTSITRFEVWLMELGILPIHIRPRHPQTQGKVERFNGSFKRERLKFHIPLDFADAQRQRLEYRDFYNHTRPHCALGLDTPAKHYIPSKREFPEKLEAWEYESGCELHKVKSSGYISLKGRGYYLSEGLAEKEVAICPSSKDNIYKILFRQYQVAKIDLNDEVLLSRKIYLIHDDPRLMQKV